VPSSRVKSFFSRRRMEFLKTSGGDEVVEQAGEFGVGEVDAVQSFELLAKIGFERSAVADVVAVGVFEVDQLGDEGVFNVLLPHRRRARFGTLLVGNLSGHGTGASGVKLRAGPKLPSGLRLDAPRPALPGKIVLAARPTLQRSEKGGGSRTC
jgi:hypothetical protein